MKTLMFRIGDQKQKFTVVSGTEKHFQTYFHRLVRNYESVFFLIDDNVEKAFFRMVSLKNFKHAVHLFHAVEKNKSLAHYKMIIKNMSSLALSKKSLFIAVGGGITLDIGAFIAATYQRGIDLVFFPTTLIGAIDASIGGKCAINLFEKKNQIGLFYPAQEVILSLSLFQTLSSKEIENGAVEMMKLGCISQRSLIPRVKKNILLAQDSFFTANQNIITKLLCDCAQAKAKIVSKDPFDNGLRKLLNLGHTLGHCLEASSHFRWSHGFCVGLGILFAAYTSFQKKYITSSEYQKIYMDFSFLHERIQSNQYKYFKNAVRYLLHDKKRIKDEIQFIIFDRNLVVRVKSLKIREIELYWNKYCAYLIELQKRYKWQHR